jgi:class 3 adenylate cyclase
MLFNSDCPGDVVITFLEDFCRFFKKQFADGVYDLLDSPPEVTGVRFGLDRGDLVRIVMLRNPEYIGRPINVACRLQSAIKDKDRRPQYKALMTKHLYSRMKNDLSKSNCKEVNRTLRNINGDKAVRCVKFNLLGD